MTELSPEAKIALSRYRDNHEPAAANVEQNLSKFHRLTAVGVASQLVAASSQVVGATAKSTVTASAASSASFATSASITSSVAATAKAGLVAKFVIATKAVVAGSLVGGTVAAAVVVSNPSFLEKPDTTELAQERKRVRQPLKQQPPRLPIPAPTAASPVAAVQEGAAQPTLVSPTRIPLANPTRSNLEPAKAPTVATVHTSNTIAPELEFVAQAKQLKGQTRLKLLANYDKRFPNGAFAIEITMLRADALCHERSYAKLSALIARFAAINPKSPRLKTLQVACSHAPSIRTQ